MAGIFGMVTRSRAHEMESIAANLGDKMVLYPWQRPQIIVPAGSGVALGAIVHDNACLAENGYCRREEGLSCVVEGYLIRTLEDCGADAFIREGRYAEAALAAYRKFGAGFVERLEGAFNVILHDADRDEFIAGTGRIANTHMYRYRRGPELLYCTQAGPMAACGFFPAEADAASIGRLLTDGTLNWTDTIIRDVQTLECASIERNELVAGRHDYRVYWTFGSVGGHESGKPFRRHLGELCEVLDAAGDRITSRPGRYVSGLSGGLDSRLVTAVATSHKPELKAWTFGSADAPDIAIAARICRQLGIEHLIFPTQPELVPQYASEYAITLEGCVSTEFAYGLKRTRGLMEHADIVLNGFAGEVILGEYMQGLNLKMLVSHLRQRRIPGGRVPHPLLARNRTIDSITAYMAFKAGKPSCLAPYMTHRPRPAYERLHEQIEAYARIMPLPFIAEHTIMANRGSRWTLMGIISDRHFYSDGSLFYDYEVLERCMSIPPAYRQGNRMYSAVFKTMMPEIGAIPNANNGLRADVGPWRALLGRVIGGIRGRMSPGHVGVSATGNRPADWSRKVYPDFYRDLLAEPRTRERPFWDGPGLSRLWEDHLAGRIDAATPIGQLAAVEFFCRRWLD